MKRLLTFSLYFVFISLFSGVTYSEVLQTRWTKTVTPENVWSEYPRPQLERKDWQNLNGLWDYAISDNNISEKPTAWNGKILIPFAIESALSGIAKQMEMNDAIWYQRQFEVPASWKSKRVILHFEAADFETTVWLNGKLIGTHKGAYDPFSFDLTESINGEKRQLLTVKVYDPQKKIYRSLGKQNGGNDEYERCSGIWQTVWLETVSPKNHINSILITPTLTQATLTTNIEGNSSGLIVKYEIFDKDKLIHTIFTDADKTIDAKISNPKLWSPDSPFLYDLKVSLMQGKTVVDEVKSYFGLRTIERKNTVNGNQFLLNGKPLFQMGPLDQSYWPDGGLTPPSDAALIWEAEYLKHIGCNMVRVHITRKPQRFYYHADKLGLLVWQDFICAQFSNKTPTRQESDFWVSEQKKLIETLYNHPSVVTWTVFNEEWGQHDSERIIDWAKTQDPSRMIDAVSGWRDIPGMGDMRDVHDYTMRPSIPALGTESRISVLGEAGGFASAIPEHNATGKANKTGTPENLLFGGFGPTVPRDNDTKHDIFRPTFTQGEPFEKQYSIFVDHLNLLRNNGLCAAVYTEITDMKREENGWLTFDREVSKVDEKTMFKIHQKLYNNPIPQQIVLNQAQNWEMSIPTNTNGANDTSIKISSAMIQTAPDFNSMKWTNSKAPFVNKGIDPNSSWDGKQQLFIRKSFTLANTPQNASVRVYAFLAGTGMPWLHTRIYINDTFVADETTRQNVSENSVAEVILPKEALDLLKNGDNKIIVQFINGYDTHKSFVSEPTEKVKVDIAVTTF